MSLSLSLRRFPELLSEGDHRDPRRLILIAGRVAPAYENNRVALATSVNGLGKVASFLFAGSQAQETPETSGTERPSMFFIAQVSKWRNR